MDINETQPVQPEQTQQVETAEAQESTFQIKPFLMACLRFWPWFLLSVVICCGLGLYYALSQQPVYSRTESVMIQNTNNGASEINEAFSSMGLITASSDVDNELYVFTSPALMDEVVRRLNLQMDYQQKGTFHPTTLYGKTLPIDVDLPDLGDDVYGSFEVELQPDGSCELSKFVKKVKDEKTEYPNTISMRTGFETHKSPLGRLIIRPNAKFTGKLTKPVTITVYHDTFDSTSQTCYKHLTGSQPSKYADIVDLVYTDVNTERADAVLSTLLDVYNEDWVEDKNQVAVATTRFIQDRLAVIEKELGNVDSDISEYKEENLIPDVSQASSAYMTKALGTDEEILQLNNQLAMANYVKDYLANPSYVNTVIPANTGIGNLELENLITKYNQLLIDRNKYAASASAAHPMVQEYEAQIKGLRESIVKAVNAHIVALNTSLRNTEISLNDSRSAIASAPGQAKYLLSAERQQKVKESLYMFLLQKLEENELSHAFTAYNTRLITPPSGSTTPIAPKKSLILLAAFLVGLLIPAAYLFIKQSNDTTIHSRSDLDRIPLPYVGEIPLYTEHKRGNFLQRIFSRREKTDPDSVPLLVNVGNRNVVNEAFRVARNNIEFMTEKGGEGANVIITTSFNSGSGKSFFTINLASSFALKHKRVLVIDGDMRHGSASTIVHSPNKGLSTYLNGTDSDWRADVVAVPEHPGLDILPAGKIPPNPAELLDSPRLKTLMDEAKEEYDLIFVDCPPVNIVVDSHIWAPFANRTIFVARAGKFLKSQVNDLLAIMRELPFKHLCIVLNGTTKEHSSYYGQAYYGNNKDYYHKYFRES